MGAQLGSGLLKGVAGKNQASLQNQMAQGNASMLDMQAQDVERIGGENADRYLGQVKGNDGSSEGCASGQRA